MPAEQRRRKSRPAEEEAEAGWSRNDLLLLTGSVAFTGHTAVIKKILTFPPTDFLQTGL
jgi:hypothetical protein